MSKLLRSEIQRIFKTHSPKPFNRRHPVIKLHDATFGPDEIMAALDCLLTTHVTMGPKVKQFEDLLCRYFHVANSIMVNSGSSANLLAFSMLANPQMKGALSPGDEVIVPALSWSTSVWPIVQHGLVPVIVDVDLETMNLDMNAVARAISPKTKAIVPIHVYGNPCPMDELMALAKKRRLLVMEDCCEALGAQFKGQYVGTFGDVGTYSFYYSHHITTLEGGLVVTKSEPLAELGRILRAHGWIRETKRKLQYAKRYPGIDPKFLFVNLGYNLRPTELQVAMGPIQLAKLESFVTIRERNACFFMEQFEEFSDIFSYQKATPGGRHSWFGFPMYARESTQFKREKFMRFLNLRGIETRPIIAGNIARQPGVKLFPHRVAGSLANSDLIMDNGFTFGNHQNVSLDACEYIVECFRDYIRKYWKKGRLL